MSWNLTVGPQGYQGDQGPQGNAGIAGLVGPQGYLGDLGFQGSQGYLGVQGTTSIQTVFQQTVDFKVAGDTVIGTISPPPPLSRFLVTKILLYYTSVNFAGSTIAPDITIGSDGSVFLFRLSDTVLPTIGINNYNYIFLPLASGQFTYTVGFATGVNIVCRVNTASNAASYTGKILVCGKYI